MPDFQRHLTWQSLVIYHSKGITHSPSGRSGLGNLQLTKVVGKCELSDMLSFRYYRFSGVPYEAVITHWKEFISNVLHTTGFRQISCAHT